MAKTISTQDCCYLSTPRHVRSFVGQLIYIYTAKGRLLLTSELLTFTSKKTSFEIPLNSITDISTGHYSRIAKPIRLDYMAVKYSHEGKDETILLTPTESWLTPVWKTNKLVADWISLLDETLHGGSMTALKQ